MHHIFFPFLSGTLGTIFLVFCVIPYFLPTIIAFARKKDSAFGIFMLNFFLGWTFIGWIASLIWALSANSRYPTNTTVIINNPGPAYTQEYDSYYRPTQHTNPTVRPNR